MDLRLVVPLPIIHCDRNIMQRHNGLYTAMTAQMAFSASNSSSGKNGKR